MGYGEHEFLYHYFNMTNSNPQYLNFKKPNTVTVQGLTGLKKTDGVNWETVKAIGFLYPNIPDTLSNILSGSSKRIKTSMLMHWQR